MKKISLIITICFIMPVYAQDWQRYSSVYIDNMSIERNETSVKAWVIHPDFDKSKLGNKKYTYEAGYFDAKCSEKEMAKLNAAWYDKYHMLVKSIPDDTSYIKIKPKTNNEIIFKAICSQGKIMQDASAQNTAKKKTENS